MTNNFIIGSCNQGCNLVSPPQIIPSACCQNLPNNFTDIYIDECTNQCNNDPSKLCCFSKCIFEKANVIDAYGSIDADKYVQKLMQVNQITFNDNNWTLISKRVVSNCIQFIKSMSTTSTCTSSSNIGIEHCIRRSFILQCPSVITSTDCIALYEYANVCISYPFIKNFHFGKREGKLSRGKGMH